MGAPPVGHAVPRKQAMRKARWTGTAVEAVSSPKLNSGPPEAPVGVPKTSVHRVPCSMDREAVGGARQRAQDAEEGGGAAPARSCARPEGWMSKHPEGWMSRHLEGWMSKHLEGGMSRHPQGWCPWAQACGARGWVCPCVGQSGGGRAGSSSRRRKGRRAGPSHAGDGRWDGWG